MAALESRFQRVQETRWATAPTPMGRLSESLVATVTFAGLNALTFMAIVDQYIVNLYMPQLDSRVKQGSSELVILALLSQRDMHGYEIGKQVEELSNGVLRFEMASLYVALYRMLRKGWAQAYWEVSPAGRKRRYYRLTKKGRLQLVPLRKNWQQLFGVLNRIAGVQNA